VTLAYLLQPNLFEVLGLLAGIAVGAAVVWVLVRKKR